MRGFLPPLGPSIEPASSTWQKGLFSAFGNMEITETGAAENDWVRAG